MIRYLYVTDVQLLTFGGTICVAFLAVLTGILMNNARLNDIKEVLRAEIKASEAATLLQITGLRKVIDTEVRSEMKALESAIALQIAELRLLIERNHSEMMLKFAEFDHRLTRLESERRLLQ